MIAVSEIRERIQNLAEETFIRKDQPITDEMTDMMDWMAEEFALVHHEINKSQDYIISQTNRSRDPEFNHRPVPNHKLHHVYPDTSTLILDPKGDPILKEEDYKGEGITRQYTALQRYLINKTYVKYKIYKNEMTTLDYQSNVITSTSLEGSVLHPAIIWWGINVTDGNSDKPVNFYMNKGSIVNTHFDLIEWTRSDGQKIHVTQGLYVVPEPERHPEFHLDHEKIYNHFIVQSTLKNYKEDYIDMVLPSTTDIPSDISNQLSEELRTSINNEDIVWIRSNFPSVFEDVDISQFALSTNLIPVCNRRMSNEMSVRAHSSDLINFNINQELRQEESFISLESVFAKSGNYHPVRIHKEDSPEPGMYVLKKVENLTTDKTYVDRRLHELYNVINANVHIYNEKRTEDLLNHIRAALQLLKSDLLTKEPEPSYQLIIHPRSASEEIMVRCWVR